MKLSELLSQIEDTIEDKFGGKIFWITAEITDVKKYYEKRWCFLKFIEKEGAQINTEIKGVFWGTTYPAITKFERLTGQTFGNGLEINCAVRIRFNKRFGLDLEVMDIDAAYSLGKLEIEKQEVLDKLVSTYPNKIHFIDGQYMTPNKELALPTIIQRIALITAPGSDGQRDFIQELRNNPYAYAFQVNEYLTTIQGDQAAGLMLKQLKEIIAHKDQFDAIAIVRGGGSQTDFKPFDNYELAELVALCPIPILTGIGHDRNTSIVDMMAKQYKTPTKVAGFIVERAYNFDAQIQYFKERFFSGVQLLLDESKNNLKELNEQFEEVLQVLIADKKSDLTNLSRIIRNLSPESILNKGFAIVMQDENIIVDPQNLKIESKIKTILKNQIIHSTVTNKEDYEQSNDL